jgi:hypothetical protein
VFARSQSRNSSLARVRTGHWDIKVDTSGLFVWSPRTEACSDGQEVLLGSRGRRIGSTTAEVGLLDIVGSPHMHSFEESWQAMIYLFSNINDSTKLLSQLVEILFSLSVGPRILNVNTYQNPTIRSEVDECIGGHPVVVFLFSIVSHKHGEHSGESGYNKGTQIVVVRCLTASLAIRQCRSISQSYVTVSPCHGRGR